MNPHSPHFLQAAKKKKIDFNVRIVSSPAGAERREGERENGRVYFCPLALQLGELFSRALQSVPNISCISGDGIRGGGLLPPPLLLLLLLW